MPFARMTRKPPSVVMDTKFVSTNFALWSATNCRNASAVCSCSECAATLIANRTTTQLVKTRDVRDFIERSLFIPTSVDRDDLRYLFRQRARFVVLRGHPGAPAAARPALRIAA